jgi:hypothetical protein
MITWSSAYTKTQRLSKDSNADTLIQLKEDWNTGYHMFNQRCARYYYRKQQFTNLIANQSIYQMPIDAVRIVGMTAQVTASYFPPLTEVVDEYEWRLLTSYLQTSSWPTRYFNIGNDEYALWPTPSQNIDNGIRYYYQMQDHDLSVDDFVGTATSQTNPNATSLNTTVSLTNNSATVTASNSVFTTNMAGLSFRLLGVTDLSWYQIVAVPNGTTLTLKSAFVGITGNSFNFQIGQTSIIPQEYQDAPMHYALGNYFSAQGNEVRANYHLGSPETPGVFYNMITQCEEDYSSSSQSSVIADGDDMYLNIWAVPPPAAM